MAELTDEKAKNELERVLAKDNTTSTAVLHAPDDATTVKTWR